VAGRPVNPFLSQDPAQKARRLARALVSDIVVYHPAKRQEGLRDGTLKELFEDEIRKSYEEYTEQVGRDLAESTGFFRDALNEILAGGRQLF
jgi:FPC/CPF motif-containing protein YcgG